MTELTGNTRSQRGSRHIVLIISPSGAKHSKGGPRTTASASPLSSAESQAPFQNSNLHQIRIPRFLRTQVWAALMYPVFPESGTLYRTDLLIFGLCNLCNIGFNLSHTFLFKQTPLSKWWECWSYDWFPTSRKPSPGVQIPESRD